MRRQAPAGLEVRHPYPSAIYGRYMFHDIGLALVDPVAKSVKLTSLVDDIKYNSSPDIVQHEGRLVYVYNKFEHLYGQRDDPTSSYGCFIGRIARRGRTPSRGGDGEGDSVPDRSRKRRPGRRAERPRCLGGGVRQVREQLRAFQEEADFFVRLAAPATPGISMSARAGPSRPRRERNHCARSRG